MRKLWVVGLLLAGLATAAPARADEWTKKYSLTGKPELHVITNDGDVEITSSDQIEIAVRVTTVGWKIGPDDVRITESQTGNHVEIEVRTPRTHVNFFNVGRRSLRIDLRIPRQTDLDIRTGDGNVNTRSVVGRTRIDTGDGNINADGLQGDVRLHTGDGHIEGSAFDGSLDAETGDGHMNVRGRFDTLNLKTGDGNIDGRVENGSKMSAAWTFHTGDGNLSLRLPENFHADLDAHTGDGHISLDFPVTVSGSLSDSTIRGKINGGGPILTLRSGDGSIRLERL